MSVRSRLEGTPSAPVLEVPPQSTVRDRGVEEDPSMPGMPTVAAPTVSLAPVDGEVSVVAPVVEAVEVPPTPVELPDKRHTWQPTDENGKPIGGQQVIVYKTEQELIEKMQEKSVLLLRQLRKERREKALGVPEERIDDAEKFMNVVEFKPRDLSADERFKISQGIANPETFADARDQLIESVFGAKPAKVASTLNEVERFMIQQRAVQNYVEFVNKTGFEDSPESRELVTGWLGTRNLAPTVANFITAQRRLTEAGLLQEVPAVQQEAPPVQTPAVAVVPPVVEEPKPQVPTAPAIRIDSEVQPQAKRHSHVPSGLTPSVASSTGVSTSVDGSSMTLADIDKMSSDEYKRRIKDPTFVKIVNQLEEDAVQRRRAKAQGQ